MNPLLRQYLLIGRLRDEANIDSPVHCHTSYSLFHKLGSFIFVFIGASRTKCARPSVVSNIKFRAQWNNWFKLSGAWYRISSSILLITIRINNYPELIKNEDIEVNRIDRFSRRIMVKKTETRRKLKEMMEQETVKQIEAQVRKTTKIEVDFWLSSIISTMTTRLCFILSTFQVPWVTLIPPTQFWFFFQNSRREALQKSTVSHRSHGVKKCHTPNDQV